MSRNLCLVCITGGYLAQIISKLDDWCKKYEDFPSYLAYVFVKGEGLSIEVRQSAGLLLKNNIKTVPISGNSLNGAIVQPLLLEGLRLRDRVLRHTAATCAASSLASSGFQSWPSILTFLLEALKCDDVDATEGALNTILKTWEDAPEAMEVEGADGMRPSGPILHQILNLCSSSNVEVKISSISIMNFALYNESSSMNTLIGPFKAVLFALANDAHPKLRKVVCIGLVHLSEMAPSQLENDIAALVEYMIVATQDADDEVALEASEFWSIFPESGFDENILKPFVPRIVPLLMKNMMFEEYDDEVAEAEAEEEAIMSGHANTVEKDSALKPHMHKSSSHLLNESVEEDQDEGDQAEEGKWNLRRSAGAGLDMISNFLGDDILPILLPAVQDCLQQSDWKAREAAILALGAVSNGCYAGLKEHLDAIVKAVLPGLTDSRPMVRCISCWTLTRYSKPICSRKRNGDSTLLDQVANSLIERIFMERNKKVQASACGSLATLMEEDPPQVKEYLHHICKALSHALNTYGRRALRAVYDAISALALSNPDAIKDQEISSILFPALFGKLDSFVDGDIEILPFLECIGIVGASAGVATLPYAELTFNRCIAISERAFAAEESGAMNPDEAQRFVEHSIDAIDGMLEGIGSNVCDIVQRSSLGGIVSKCTTHPNPALRQSAFGILGDLASNCMLQILPLLPQSLDAAFETVKPENINQESLDGCNNAVWFVGVVSKMCSPEDVHQYALLGLERMYPLLSFPVGALPRSLVENAAVCLGRISRSSGDVIAKHITSSFLAAWCGALRGLRDGEEKRDAYEGLCKIVRLNPDVGLSQFGSICECFASWSSVPEEGGLKMQMSEILEQFGSHLVSTGKWEDFARAISPAVLRKLHMTQ